MQAQGLEDGFPLREIQGSFARNVAITEDIFAADICISGATATSSRGPRGRRGRGTASLSNSAMISSYVRSWDSGGKVEELVAAVGAGVIASLFGCIPSR